MATISQILKENNIEPKIDAIEGVFNPNTLTTKLIENFTVNEEDRRVVDLGSGVSPIGISYALANPNAKVFSLEYQQEAVEQARKNIVLNNVQDRVHALNSDVYTGLMNFQVNPNSIDTIYDDIAGIASGVCAITTWYKGVPMIADENGTNLAIKAVEGATTWLKKGGKIYVPVSTLSKKEDIVNAMKKRFDVNLIHKGRMPFCPELLADLRSENSVLKNLREEGVIDFTEKGTRAVWGYEIYEGTYDF